MEDTVRNLVWDSLVMHGDMMKDKRKGEDLRS